MIFPVRKIIEKRSIDPKNILEKVTTQLDSLFSMTFFDIVFSIAQRIVAPRIRKSPALISAESFVNSMMKSPSSIMPRAVSCRFVIFSFKNMKPKISA